MERRIALKVDCDTFEGTKNGIPNLLAVFKYFGIKASFYFTLGPDTSGRAVFRIFTQKGFLKKMLRSNAAAMYGPKTMLYGTLLPSPMIGEKLGEVIKSVETAGHEVGIHGWDHVRWHDRLSRMSEASIDHDFGRAFRTFEKIFGHKAHVAVAPGWHITGTALRVLEKYNIRYTSNTRGGEPFFPDVDGRKCNILEIPSTLPTWDEMMGIPELKNETEFLEFYRQLIKGTEIHSIHTEVEGTAKLDLFRRQIDLWLKDGVQFVSLETIALEKLQNPNEIPMKNLARVTIPYRGGFVSAGRKKD